MNELQEFMADAMRQTRAVNQEQAIINNSKVWITFSDPNMVPEMVRQGYDGQIVYSAIASADQFASPPPDHGTLTRCQTNAEYFIQMVHRKDPVAYTFILTDRQP